MKNISGNTILFSALLGNKRYFDIILESYIFFKVLPMEMQEINTRDKTLYRATQIIWSIFTIIEVALLFRFVLKLLGANPTAEFTKFVYSFSNAFAGPFNSVFPTVRAEGSVFEWSTLLAMFVFWLISIGLIRLMSMGRKVSVVEAQEKLNEGDR